MFKNLLKSILPIKFVNIINNIIGRSIKINGNYSTWEQALNYSLGYDNKIIFNKSKKSFLKVESNKFAYERDSVLFEKENINYPLIDVINLIQKKKNKKLNILDYGGSFGSTYFQNKKILSNEKKFQWSIIEQPMIVNFFLKRKLNSNLRFYKSLTAYCRNNVADVVLMSSVLQYIKFPFILLDKLIDLKIDYLLALKTPVHDKSDEIKVQIIPNYIYKASYPIRIFDKTRLLHYFKINNYQLIKNNFTNEFVDKISFENFFFKRNSY